MSFIVTKYPPGTFCWTDIMSSDFTKSRQFMISLMGWDAQNLPTDAEDKTYTMFSIDGHQVAGGSQMPDEMKAVPSHWNSYVTVEDLESMVKKVEELGGKIVMPPMEVMTAGKMASIQDPTGAQLMLWQAKDHQGASLVNTTGAMGWNELYTKDTDKARKFYGDLFGWTFDVDSDSNYIIIKNNDRMNGGIMEITKEMGEIPPNWMTYFTVENIEKTVNRAKELGGLVPKGIIDAGVVGKIAMIQDPTEAHFMSIELKTPAEPWTE